MNHRHQTRRGPAAVALTAVGVVVLVVASWLVVGPSSLGGPFSYVFVRGSSMEPQLHNRDLVLLRTRGHYVVGDMVAYRHPDLGTVLHRIVGEQYGAFTMKGDNRPDEDSYQPRAEDIVGAVWLNVPGATPVIQALQTPRNAALLVVAVGALGVGTGFGKSKRPVRRRDGPKRRKPDRGNARTPAGAGGLGALGAYSATGGVLAGLAVTLVVVSVVLPRAIDPAATTTTTDTRSYDERATFTYERTVLGGVYDGDRLTAPQPLFRQLASTLPVAFDYALDAPGAPGLEVEDARGTLELWAELRRGDGWSRRIELRPALEFTGAHATIESLIDLQSTDTLMNAVTEATGVGSGTYALRVYASYEATAEFAGQPIDRSGEQFMEFNVSELSVELILGASEMLREDSGVVPVIAVQPATFSLPVLGTEVANAAVPGYAQLARIGAGALLVIVALATWLTWHAGEDARIRARHGALLLRAALSEHRSAARTVTVSQFADLARVAEAEGLLVLHEPHLGGGIEYRVFAADATYRYRSDGGSSLEASPFASDDQPDVGRPMPFGPSSPPGAPFGGPGLEGVTSSPPAAPVLPPSVLPPVRRREDAA